MANLNVREFALGGAELRARRSSVEGWRWSNNIGWNETLSDQQ
jgi:hypothetical protein